MRISDWSSDVCSSDLVTTTVQTPDIVVAHAADHFQQFGVFAEEILAYKLAVVRLVGLVFAVDGLFHDPTQNAFFIACQEGIPVAAPDKLDDVPAAAAEIAFEFLEDFALTADRPVNAPQVARKRVG